MSKYFKADLIDETPEFIIDNDVLSLSEAEELLVEMQSEIDRIKLLKEQRFAKKTSNIAISIESFDGLTVTTLETNSTDAQTVAEEIQEDVGNDPETILLIGIKDNVPVLLSHWNESEDYDLI